MKTQQTVNNVLAKVETKIESVSTQVGGLFETTLKAALNRPEEQVQAQAREGAPTSDPNNPINLFHTELGEDSPPGKTVLELFTLRGLRFSNVMDHDGQLFFQLGADRNFNLFDGAGQRVVYYGHFYCLEAVDVIARVRILIGRVDALRRHLSSLPTEPVRDHLLTLLAGTPVTVLVPPQTSADRVQHRIQEFQPEDWSVSVVAMTPDDLEREYRAEIDRMRP